MPPESAFRVVSLPAMMSRKKFTCVIIRLIGAPWYSPFTRLKKTSSVGRFLRSLARSADWMKICSKAKRARSRLKDPGSPKRMVSLVQR